MGFNSGLQALDNEIKSASNKSSGFGPFLPYFSLKDTERKILRFLSDEPIIAEVCEWVICSDGKTRDFVIDPEGQNWCAYYGGTTQDFVTKQIVAAKPRKVGLGIAVLREERHVGGGKTEIGDYYYDKEWDGKTYRGRQFYLVKQSIPNFWGTLRGLTRRQDTLVDRDFEITRVGSDKSTSYGICPIEPDDAMRDVVTLQKMYGYGRPFDDKDPDKYLYCPQTLQEWAELHASQEWAKKWLGDGQVQSQQQQHSSALDEFRQQTSHNPVAEDEAQAVAPTGTGFSSLKDRLLPHTQKSSSAV